MNDITIHFNELRKAISQLEAYNCKCVTLTLLEPEEDSCGDLIPATLVLSCGDVEEYIESISN